MNKYLSVLVFFLIILGCNHVIPSPQKECRIEVQSTSGQLIDVVDSLHTSQPYLVHVELPDSIGQNFVVAVSGNSRIELLPSSMRDNYKLTPGNSDKIKILVFGRFSIGKDPICEREHIIPDYAIENLNGGLRSST